MRERLAPYEALGYTIVPLSAKRDAAPALPWLHGQHTVLVGQSGMGKSTLINALVPDATKAVPRSVCRSSARSIPERGPVVPATNPTKAVITTKTVMRGFVSDT